MSTALATMSDHDDPAPLCNPEAEYFLLCTLLRDRQALEAVADRLDQADFSDPFLARMYGMLVSESSCGREPNALTIRPLLERDPDFEAFGGWQAIAQMTGSTVVLLSDWRGIASDLARYASRRRMVEALLRTKALAEDPSGSEADLFDAADAAISSIVDTKDATVVQSAGELALNYVDHMDDPVVPGVLSRRAKALDVAIGPIRRKHFVIGAGRPGMGKTATALSYAVGAAKEGHGVLFISLEMGADELTERILADMCFDGRGGVPYEAITEHRATIEEKRELCRAAEAMRDLPLHIYDTAALTIAKLDRVIRRFRRKMQARGQSLDLVIIDYLQLMSSVDKRANRYETVSEVSRGCKALAKSHDLGIMALAQLSREVEKRPDKRPILADLKESGSLEQDADVVVFFFRLAYYLQLGKPQDETSVEYDDWLRMFDGCRDELDFICAKRRHGRPGTVRGKFHSEYQAVR